MKNRRAQFSSEFGEFKESYQALGDYRECRDTVGGLYLTQIPDYPFATKDAADKALQKLKGLGLEPGAVTTRSAP